MYLVKIADVLISFVHDSEQVFQLNDDHVTLRVKLTKPLGRTIQFQLYTPQCLQ